MEFRGVSNSIAAVLFVVGILVGAFALTDQVSTSNGAAAQPAASVSSTSILYLNLSVILANRLHDFMLNSTSNAYYFELSDNWQKVVTSSYSTLGNALITLGVIQLYQATGNQTYLRWVSSNAESFWRNGWDTVHGGFYDTYSTIWKNTTCQQTTQPNALFSWTVCAMYSDIGTSLPDMRIGSSNFTAVL